MQNSPATNAAMRAPSKVPQRMLLALVVARASGLATWPASLTRYDHRHRWAVKLELRTFPV
jgi:hypothetical protein